METKRATGGYLQVLLSLIVLSFTVFLPLLTFIMTSRPVRLYAAMNSYCVVPPYVKKDVKPNILILMDNATGMGDRAYTPISKYCDAAAANTTMYCPSTQYTGLFKPNYMYKYTSNQWLATDTAPSPPDVYISGNLLNWATTSKYDLLESIIVGGKSTSRQTNVNTLVSVSNSWTATLSYTDSASAARNCLFVVNNANVEIKDDPAEAGSCGYFDDPRMPVPNDYPVLHPHAAIEPEYRFADNTKEFISEAPSPSPSPSRGEGNNTAPPLRGGDEGEGDANGFTNDRISMPRILRMAMGLLNGIIDLMSTDAEAASPLKMPGGPTALSDGTECVSYMTSLTATGGTGTAYTYSITSGSLPPGLSLATAGTPGTATISGTPITGGSDVAGTTDSYGFTITVTDSGANTDSKAYTISIIDQTVSITTASPLPDGYNNVWYRESITATGTCTGNYSWSITAGKPGWMAINGTDQGVHYTYIAGTPSLGVTPTTYNFTVRVIDTQGNSTTKTFQLTIQANPGGPVQILTTAVDTPWTKNVAYPNTTISTNAVCGSCCNCSGTYAWSISGTLPTGLIFNSGTFCDDGDHTYIYGTPTAPGTYNFTVEVTCGGNTDTQDFTVVIEAPPISPRSSGNLNVKICAGGTGLGTDYNCNTGGVGQLKSGILDSFWTQARFGLEDFTTQAVANIEGCDDTDPTSGETPDSNFLTAVENATPANSTTPLVNATYLAVHDYFEYAANPGGCDPFDNAQACLKNFVLMITDGAGADTPANPVDGTGKFTTIVPTECTNAAYSNLSDNACYGFRNDLRNHTPAVGNLDPDLGLDNLSGKQNVSTYVVNTMGAVVTPNRSCTGNSPLTTGDNLCQAAGVGGGVYYEVTDPATLKSQLEQAFQDIIKRAAAGTAASVLASGEGSGANLVQAVFYPRKRFLDSATGTETEIAWVGRLSNFWYYIDPFFAASSIYEDNASAAYLDLTNDNKITLSYNTTLERVEASRMVDTTSDGVPDSILSTVDFESLKTLWEGGTELWKRDISTDPRTIYTNCSVDNPSCLTIAGGLNAGLGSNLMAFSTAKKTQLSTYLQAADDAEAEAIIRYLHGEDTPFNPVIAGFGSTYRPRKVKVDLNGDGDTADAGETTSKVWKLGDVLDSTPKISSWVALNAYDKAPYSDSTYTSYLETNTSTTGNYKNRGMVFAGANDGMLHAFNLGKLELPTNATTCTFNTQYKKACLSGTNFGKEMWAFIPKNSLPYLKYFADPDYCHIYSIDLTPYVFDASINKPSGCGGGTNYWDCAKTVDSWRTIVIGGMRYGGACRDATGSCNSMTGGLDDCVKTPVTGKGFSSYFALDVTDQNNPQLLWEYSHPDLGFTTSGPAVVKISARTVSAGASSADNSKNGRWFVVFGSGPTGPVDTAPLVRQFMGRSDQDLKLFVLDLKTGALATTNPLSTSPAISNAFAGSLLNSTHDADQDYQDDAIYIPYVRKCVALDDLVTPICDATLDTWTNGGVVRLLTKEDQTGTDLSGTSGNTALNPNTWVLSKVMDGIGPVTSSVVKLQNKNTNKLWLYFGAGRYYFEQGSNTDDPANQRRLFGITEPCLQSNGTFDSTSTCSTLRTLGELTPVDLGAEAGVNDPEGWYINMDLCTDSGGTTAVSCALSTAYYRAERVITDPLATITGLVYFTSYKPYRDECSLGGKSAIWAVKYDTGGAAGALLKGKAILQVSTGSIEQLDLSTAFDRTIHGDAPTRFGRRTTLMEGVPPTAQGLSILSSPPAVKRILHMRER